MKKLNILTIVLSMMCALCFVGCKNAAEDSGSSTPTPPSGFQITDAASFKTFASNSETVGVVASDFTLDKVVEFTSTTVEKKVDFFGHTITVNGTDTGVKSGAVGAGFVIFYGDTSSGFVPTKKVTFCNSSTTTATIKGSGGSISNQHAMICNMGTFSLLDGIDIDMSVSDNNANQVCGMMNYATVDELNANMTAEYTGTGGSGSGNTYGYCGENHSQLPSLGINSNTKAITGGTYIGKTDTGNKVYGVYIGQSSIGDPTISSNATFCAQGKTSTKRNYINAHNAGELPGNYSPDLAP